VDFGSGFRLFTVRANGTHIRRLTSSGDALNPDWSPDGRRLVYGLDDRSIVLANAFGHTLREFSPPQAAGQPAFTPDGRRIVFERFLRNGDDNIWTMRRGGGGMQRLTRNPFPHGFDTDPNVSPDGRHITFVRIREEGVLQAIFSIRRDGSHLRQVTPYALEVGVKHDWAPDGSRIVVTTTADFPRPGDSANVATVRPDGSRLRMLTHFRGGEENAFAGSYSPDGRWIVFRHEDHSRFTIAKLPAEGGRPRSLRSLAAAPRFIDWGSPP
jgi:Tol biopolymer transport system component